MTAQSSVNVNTIVDPSFSAPSVPVNVVNGQEEVKVVDTSVKRVRKDAKNFGKGIAITRQYINDCLTINIAPENIVKALIRQLADSGLWLMARTGKGRSLPVGALCGPGDKAMDCMTAIGILQTMPVNEKTKELLDLAEFAQAIRVRISQDKKAKEKAAASLEPDPIVESESSDDSALVIPDVLPTAEFILEWSLASIAAKCFEKGSKLSKKDIGEMIIAALA